MKRTNLRNIFLLIVILMSTLACQALAGEQGDAGSPTDAYLGLRNIWFTSTPEDFGTQYEPGSAVPYAVVMDMGISGEVATLGSSNSGEASLYFSNGGGILGGGDYEDVRAASVEFVRVSTGLVEKMKLTTEFPLPNDGMVKFYLVTPSGVYTTDEMNADVLARGDQEFSSLFLAGNDVITELRLISGN